MVRIVHSRSDFQMQEKYDGTRGESNISAGIGFSSVQQQMGGGSLKLSYVDFWPQCVDPGSMMRMPTYERFDVLVSRANAYLSQNAGLEVKTCESVERKMQYGRQIDYESMSYLEYGSSSNVFVRGLRLWVSSRDPSLPPQQLGYMNVVPACLETGGFLSFPKFETLNNTLQGLNQMLRNQPIPGQIITVETQEMKYRGAWKSGCIDPDSSSWWEAGKASTLFLFIIRVFYIVGPPAYEEIGFADFIPDQTGTRKIFFTSLPTFSTFTSVVLKAQAWLQQQQNIRVTNVLSVDIKMDSSGFSSSFSLDPQNMFYIQYGGASTVYIKMLRVAYVTSRSLPPCPSPVTLTEKTFYPVKLRPGGMMSMPQYETITQTMQRIIAWMNYCGARVLCVETVPLRTSYTGGSSAVLYGAPHDETLWFSAGKGSMLFEYLIRVYFDGYYQEPPPEALPPVPVMQPASNDCCVVL